MDFQRTHKVFTQRKSLELLDKIAQRIRYFTACILKYFTQKKTTKVTSVLLTVPRNVSYMARCSYRASSNEVLHQGLATDFSPYLALEHMSHP